MELNCPNCDTEIHPDNINIQDTLALCDKCGHVFDFKGMIPARKRKPKTTLFSQPKHISIEETNEAFALSFRFGFGPGQIAAIIGSTIGSVLLPIAMIASLLRGDVDALPLLVIVTPILWYFVAMFMTGKTTIAMDDETIEVSSGPLPFLISDDKTLNTESVKRIYCDQTVEPIPPWLPAFHVYVEGYEGERKILLRSLSEEYAVYIAHQLDNHLHDCGNEIVTATEELLFEEPDLRTSNLQ